MFIFFLSWAQDNCFFFLSRNSRRSILFWSWTQGNVFYKTDSFEDSFFQSFSSVSGVQLFYWVKDYSYMFPLRGQDSAKVVAKTFHLQLSLYRKTIYNKTYKMKNEVDF